MGPSVVLAVRSLWKEVGLGENLLYRHTEVYFQPFWPGISSLRGSSPNWRSTMAWMSVT